MREEVFVKKEGTDVEYLDVAVSFDIETTSFITKDNRMVGLEEYNSGGADFKAQYQKYATMYIWQMDFNDEIIIGRTWEEFNNTLKAIREKYRLNINRRVIIWVHNLAFELDFIYKYLDIDYDKSLSVDSHKPCVITTRDGFEFRCSFLFSGTALGKIKVNGLHKLNDDSENVDLDYSKIRHSTTPLTDKELEYCIVDVKLVNAYIEEQTKYYPHICDFPYTSTGKVRRIVRERCLESDSYREKIKELTMTWSEYELLNKCYSGGFTHASPLHVLDICESISHVDFISSYPAMLTQMKFPMGKGKKIDLRIIDTDSLKRTLKKKACLMHCVFRDIESTVNYDYPISESKCLKTVNAQKFNGRIWKASAIEIVINDVDFGVFKKFYNWKKFELKELWVYDYDYLPKEFIECILDLYKDKVELKGSPDIAAAELAKILLNACYGMCCMAVDRQSVVFEDGNYNAQDVNKLQMLAIYNTSKNRFLFYPWGVWCSSLAKSMLLANVYSGFKKNYVYADTDSIFYFDNPESEEYIKKYNDWVLKRIDAVCAARGIDKERYMPKGKVLGQWSYEDHSARFCSLGIKRYLEQHDDGKYKLVFSGIKDPRGKGINYLLKKAEERHMDPFEVFKDDIDFKWDSGCHTTAYRFKNEIEGTITDYLGNEGYFHEMSGVSLIATNYKGVDVFDEFLEHKAMIDSGINHNVIHN